LQENPVLLSSSCFANLLCSQSLGWMKHGPHHQMPLKIINSLWISPNRICQCYKQGNIRWNLLSDGTFAYGLEIVSWPVNQNLPCIHAAPHMIVLICSHQYRWLLLWIITIFSTTGTWHCSIQNLWHFLCNFWMLYFCIIHCCYTSPVLHVLVICQFFKCICPYHWLSTCLHLTQKIVITF